MTAGLNIRLDQPYSSDIVYVQSAALSKPVAFRMPGTFALRPATPKADAFSVRADLEWATASHATSYRVTVWPEGAPQSPIVRQVVLLPRISLSNLPGGANLLWQVEAFGWAGTTFNAGGPQSFETPAIPQLHGKFVSDIAWVGESAGAGNSVRRDLNYYGQRLHVGGKTMSKGLWTHAFPDETPADIVVSLAGHGFASFEAEVGVDDASGGGSVQFQVLVDGKVAAVSPIMTHGKLHVLKADVSRGSLLTLRVLNAGDGYDRDHAVWGLARLLVPDRPGS